MGILSLVPFVIFIAAIAVLAFVFARLFDRYARGIGWVWRAVLAALLASFIPTAPGFLYFSMLLPGESLTFVDFVPLLIGWAVFALIIGFPVAYFVTRKKVREREQSISPTTFE